MQKITPFLWFDDKAEEAANFYISLFKNSKIISINRIDGAPGPQSKVTSLSFQLEGQEFMALNGGPHYQFTPAISLYVDCQSQAEVDELWSKLTDGGQELMCGWLTDKFGVTWQIIPSDLGGMISSSDAEKSRRAMEAMLQMKKINIEKIRQAYEGI